MLFKVNAKKSFEEISLGWLGRLFQADGKKQKENALKTKPKEYCGTGRNIIRATQSCHNPSYFEIASRIVFNPYN